MTRRILHVIASIAADSGGPAHALAGLCKASQAQGHTVEVATTTRGLSSSPPVDVGAPVHVFDTTFPFARGFSAGLWRASMGLVEQADIVHVHSLYLFHTWLFWSRCRTLHRPLVLRPHGALDGYHMQQRPLRKAVGHFLLQEQILNEAQALHFTSTAELGESAFGSDPRAHVVPLPFTSPTPAVNDAAAFREHWAIPPGVPVLLFLGRLHHKKRVALVVRTLATERLGSAHLIVVGPDAGEEENLRRLVIELGLDSRVTFTGPLYGAAKSGALGAADVFILPSLSENFGVAVLDALHHGTPVVLTSGVAIASEIASAGVGLVQEPTPEALAGGIGRLLDDGPSPSACQQFVRERYGPAVVGAMLDRMYDDAEELAG